MQKKIANNKKALIANLVIIKLLLETDAELALKAIDELIAELR